MASQKSSAKSSPARRPAPQAPSAAPAKAPPPHAAASAAKSVLPPPRRTKGLSPYSRVCWILEELKAGRRWNVPDLMKHLDISKSSARRDIDHLRVEFQQEIEFDPEKNSFVLVNPDKPLPHVPVTRGELFMLMMAKEALGAHADSRYGNTLHAAIGKLSASLDQRLEGGLAELTKSICFRTLGGSVRHSALAFDTAAEALGSRRELFFDYRSHKRTKPALWKFWPRCLVCQDGVWYLMGHRGSLKQAYTLSLSRMSNLRLGDKTFEPEPNEGPTLRESLSSSIGIFGGKPELVRVRFQGAAARLVGEMALHDSQEMEPFGEDGLELTMEVAVNRELERFLLGWGEEAEVMEPPALREKITGRLHQTAALYEKPAAPPVGRRGSAVAPAPSAQ